MKTLKLLSAGLLIWTVLGCQAKNATLTNPPEKVSKVGEKGVALDYSFNPKVDILFVIDDSMSMDDEQKALSTQIDRFVSAFAQYELIDFHIGVTRVTDLNEGSVAARKAYAAQCAGKSPDHKIPYVNGISFECRHVVADQAPRGELVTLKNIDSKTNKLVEYPDLPRYVTRNTPDYLNVLKNTLKVGLKYVQYGGSEFEEIFHPMKGVFDNPQVQKTNAGFYRPDAAVLAIFVLTDADDAVAYDIKPGSPARPMPNLTAEMTAAYFSNKVKTGKLLTFSGLSLGNCQKDPILQSGKAPTAMQDFLAYTGGKSMDICSADLGDKLAAFGQAIKKEVMTKGFSLSQGQPQSGTLKLFYGGVPVPERNSKGEQMWGYEVDANGHNPRIVITENIELTDKKGAIFTTEYIPLVMKNVKNGRTRIDGLYSNPKK